MKDWTMMTPRVDDESSLNNRKSSSHLEWYSNYFPLQTSFDFTDSGVSNRFETWWKFWRVKFCWQCRGGNSKLPKLSSSNLSSQVTKPRWNIDSLQWIVFSVLFGNKLFPRLSWRKFARRRNLFRVIDNVLAGFCLDKFSPTRAFREFAMRLALEHHNHSNSIATSVSPSLYWQLKAQLHYTKAIYANQLKLYQMQSILSVGVRAGLDTTT